MSMCIGAVAQRTSILISSEEDRETGKEEREEMMLVSRVGGRLA
jgi:hypothetical protein